MSEPTHVTRGSVLVDIMSLQELADAFVDRDTKLAKAESRLKLATEALEDAIPQICCGSSFGHCGSLAQCGNCAAKDELRAALARIKEPE